MFTSLMVHRTLFQARIESLFEPVQSTRHSNMVRRLTQGSHECVVYDVNTDAVEKLASPGVIGATSLEDMIGRLAKPQKIWLMIPTVLTAHQISALKRSR